MAAAIRKPLESLAGHLVRAYLNLHLPGRLSVQAMEGAAKGRVVGHPLALILQDCRLVVSEAGRQRVLRERCKNVHAGVVGRVVSAAFEATELGAFEAEYEHALVHGIPLRYNPYETPLFSARSTGAPVVAAKTVILLGGRLVATDSG